MTTAELIQRKYKQLVGNEQLSCGEAELSDWEVMIELSKSYNLKKHLEQNKHLEAIIYILLEVIKDLNNEDTKSN